jgi:hypothetical protein
MEKAPIHIEVIMVTGSFREAYNIISIDLPTDFEAARIQYYSMNKSGRCSFITADPPEPCFKRKFSLKKLIQQQVNL